MKSAILVFFLLLTFTHAQTESFIPALISESVSNYVHVLHSTLNSTACAKDLQRLATDLITLQPWAINMLDSTGKPESGFLKGNIQFNGIRNKCLSISGQYCTVPINFYEDFVRHLHKMAVGNVNSKLVEWKTFRKHFRLLGGICVPKSCTIAELGKLWTVFQRRFLVPADAEFKEEACFYRDKPVPSNVVDSYVLFAFFLVLSLEVGSTFYCVYMNGRKEAPGILACFSFYENAKKLLRVTKQQSNSLSCLFGIKSISMVWIMLGHTMAAKMATCSNLRFVVTEWTKRVHNTFLWGSPYAVDTFFSISGILLVYICLQYQERLKVNAFSLYLHRVVRLLPPLVAAIAVNVTFAKYLVDGPVPHLAIKSLATTCEANWWVTVLFANSFLKNSVQCLPHAWYLTIDTIMYIASPLILYGIKRNAPKTFWTIFIICLSSFVYTWTLVIRNNYGFLIYWEVFEEAAAITYMSTLCRMPTWLIGTFFGYILHQQQVKRVKLSKNVDLSLLVLSLGTMSTIILWHYKFLNEGHDVYRSAFFNTFSRALWSLAVCYIIFRCNGDRGGLINSFLSHPIFVVLGKLTYSIFLGHVTVITIVTNAKQPSPFNNFEIFFDFCGICLITLIYAVALHLMFEEPTITFFRHLQMRLKKKHVE